MNILFAIMGLALLLFGGNLVVRGALGLSHRFGISPLLVGIVVIGFGTSLPEVAVCIRAALAGSSDLATGNIIGSNIANTLLILGLAALIYPVALNTRNRGRDTIALVTITMAFAWVGFSQGQIDWWHGLIMIILLLGYIALAANQRSEAFAVEGDAPAIQAIGAGMITLFLIVGFAAILGGSELLVSGSVGLAEQLGIPNEIIGLTVIAIGTSLPEMATTFTAAWQRNTQLCFGNVIGSNLFNISGIAGLTALVAPLPISDDLLAIDLPILVATTLMLSVMMLWGRPIGRMTGFLLAAGYAAFIGMRVLSIVP